MKSVAAAEVSGTMAVLCHGPPSASPEAVGVLAAGAPSTPGTAEHTHLQETSGGQDSHDTHRGQCWRREPRAGGHAHEDKDGAATSWRLFCRGLTRGHGLCCSTNLARWRWRVWLDSSTKAGGAQMRPLVYDPWYRGLKNAPHPKIWLTNFKSHEENR